MLQDSISHFYGNESAQRLPYRTQLDRIDRLSGRSDGLCRSWTDVALLSIADGRLNHPVEPLQRGDLDVLDGGTKKARRAKKPGGSDSNDRGSDDNRAAA
jgi:hypothetical protein